MRDIQRFPLTQVGLESQLAPSSIRIARTLLVFTLMAAPLAFGAVQTWAWASLAVIAAILTILWAIGCIQQRRVAVYWSALYIPAGLFLLLAVSQFAGHLTLDSFRTREALTKLATNLLFFFLAGQLWATASTKTWKKFGLAVAIYACSISLFAILQFFSSDGLLYWVVHTKGYVFGSYVNHNDYAGLMEMLIPVAMCYALSRSRRTSQRILLLLAVCGAIASVLLSGSRGGVISVVIEMVFLGALLWHWEVVRSVRSWGVLGLTGIVGVAVLFLVITPANSWQRLASVTGLAHQPDVTLGSRLEVSRDTLAVLRDYPWLGAGLGSFETVFPQYQTFPTDLGWTHAHNDYVEALAETGVVGGLLILSALLLFARLAFRNFPDRLKNPRGWIQLGAALGCCGLLVHSLADFNLSIPANAAWFAACAALSTVSGVTPRPREGSNRRSELNQAQELAGADVSYTGESAKNVVDKLVETEK